MVSQALYYKIMFVWLGHFHFVTRHKATKRPEKATYYKGLFLVDFKTVSDITVLHLQRNVTGPLFPILMPLRPFLQRPDKETLFHIMYSVICISPLDLSCRYSWPWSNDMPKARVEQLIVEKSENFGQRRLEAVFAISKGCHILAKSTGHIFKEQLV